MDGLEGSYPGFDELGDDSARPSSSGGRMEVTAASAVISTPDFTASSWMIS